MAETYILPQPYHEIEHTADVGIRVLGASEEECLARLVLGYTALTLGKKGPPLEAESTRPLSVTGDERLSMVVDVLRELLYIFDTDRQLPAACTVVSFDEHGITLELGMAPIDEDAHEDVIDLKAVTWHEASFEPVSDGWGAQVIFDV